MPKLTFSLFAFCLLVFTGHMAVAAKLSYVSPETEFTNDYTVACFQDTSNLEQVAQGLALRNCANAGYQTCYISSVAPKTCYDVDLETSHLCVCTARATAKFR